MEIINKNKNFSLESGQTLAEYLLLMVVMVSILFLSLDTMRKPVISLMETLSQGFQSVVRYGDRRIRAENAFEDEHPGHPSKIAPKHF